MSAPLPKPIQAYLRSFARRRQKLALVRQSGLACCLVILWIILACLVDRLVPLQGTVRLALLAFCLVVPIAVLFSSFVKLHLRHRDWLFVAADLEEVNPAFGERLRTAVSQLLEREEYRGSPELLESLVSDVCRQVAQDDLPATLPYRSAWIPWLLAGVLLIATVCLIAVPYLNLPVLLTRFALPWMPTPPVTTTRISVEPGNSRVLSGDSLTVKAHVARLTSGSVDALTSQDGNVWLRTPMTPVGEGEYVISFPSLDRDLSYWVEGGDASTDVFTATVLRRPAIASFRVRYEYPAYTRRGSLTVASADGVLEALRGTHVTIALTATEPLESAWLTVAGRQIGLGRTAQRQVFQGQLIIQENCSADLGMVGVGGLRAEVPQALTIRALPDREPLVRMLEPLEDLRLHPRDLLAMRYQAIDDYGTAVLNVSTQVNALPPRRLPVRRSGDPRRQEGQFVLDLAALNVKVGDVIGVSLLAEDAAGNQSSTAVRRILISPRSVDMNTHVRIAELKQAADLTAAEVGELERAVDAMEHLRKGREASEAEEIAQRLRVTRSLANSAESGLLAHQALLRACAKSASPAETSALADCIDKIRTQSAVSERYAALDWSGAAEAVVSERLRGLLESARQLASTIVILSEGEQAAAVLADRTNLAARPSTQPGDSNLAEPQRETLRRAAQDLEVAVRELGLTPQSPELESQLQQKVASAHRVVLSAKPVEFMQSARDWSTAVTKGEVVFAPLPERLSSAAMVESVRPDTDPRKARDYQLMSKAAARLSDIQVRQAGPDPVRDALAEFPSAIAALQQEHLLPSRSPREENGAGSGTVHEAAASSRSKLLQWLRLRDPAIAASDEFDADDLALAASAATARRQYEEAAAMDEAFAGHAVDDPERRDNLRSDLQAKLEKVRRIDRAAADQQSVADQTAQAGAVDQVRELAGRQQQVAEGIARIAHPDDDQHADSREQAAAIIQRVQEQLAHLPQQIPLALDAAGAYRRALSKAEQAGRDAAAAPPEQRAGLQRSVEQAQMALREMDAQLEDAIAPLLPAVAADIAKSLQGYEPEAGEAVHITADLLQPALHLLEQAVRSRDTMAVERAAQRVRTALERTQDALRDAQGQLLEQDPLMAARWFAQAAATALADRPPDLSRARSHQESTSVALNRAWQEAVRDSSVTRLSESPRFRPILGAPYLADAPSVAGPRSIGQWLLGIRQWGFLPARQPEGLQAPVHETDSPGYQEPLRLYFEGLANAQGRPSPQR